MVLDSSALVAIFKQEPGHEILQQKIDEAALVLIGAPTLLETAMVLTRLTGKSHQILLDAYLRRIDAIIVDFTKAHYALATEAFVRFGRGFNSKSSLNFGDCLSYAIAALSGDKLLFTGADFTHTDIVAA